jgi:hypothetical protein
MYNKPFLIKMKLSQLKQIIKEEINELGFDYPGKEQTPSAYQNGIMDTLKAMQQLGVNIDVQAVMDIIYPDDESPKDENPINETEDEIAGMLNRLDKNKSLKVDDVTTIKSGKYKGKKVKIVADLGGGSYGLEFVS